MDLFFIDYKGKQVEVIKAENAEAYEVHLPEGKKIVVPYELPGKKGWRFYNEELSSDAQEIGELIEKSFIIRVKDSDVKTLEEYFGKDKKKE